MTHLGFRRVVPALSAALLLCHPTNGPVVERASDAAYPVSIVKPLPVHTPLPRGAVHGQDPRAIVRERASRVGWVDDEWRCLDTIIWLESKWDPKAANHASTARGLFQRLNERPNLPVEDQARLGLKYVKERYGSPCKALTFHVLHGYY